MQVDIPPAVAEIVARAFASGTETSVLELSTLLGYSQLGRLSAAEKVLGFVSDFHLELIPSVLELEYESPRVLRSARADASPEAGVEALLQKGETSSVEFKSSMLVSMRDWKTEGKLLAIPALPGELLKTICAFLNTDGGDLLVGVNDDGQPCAGISLDLELKNWNLDSWQLHLRSLIKERFYNGAAVQPFLKTEMAIVNSMPVCRVNVLPRATRTFVQREKGRPYEFFLRNGPRTDSLDLPSFYAHIA